MDKLPEWLKALLRSRKFWLSVVGIAQTVVLNVLGADPQLWQAIDAILAILIATITVEDAAEKANRNG